MNANSPTTLTYNSNNATVISLNGYSVTVSGINGGLFGGAGAIIQNGGSTPATLTVNVAGLTSTSSFGGMLQDGGAHDSAPVKTGGGALSLSPFIAPNNTFTGGLTIAAGAIETSVINNASTNGPLGNEPGVTLGSSGQIGGIGFAAGSATYSSNMPFTLVGGGGSFSVQSSNLVLSGPISGSAALYVGNFNGGRLTLAGNNTFTGGLTITGGTLQIGSAGALNAASPNSISFINPAFGSDPHETFNLNGTSITVAGLNGPTTAYSPTVQNANATPATLTINNVSTSNFSLGFLQDGPGGGPLAIIKSGPGTFVIGDDNFFTGGLTVSAGTLQTEAVNNTNTNGALGVISSVTLGSAGQTGTLDYTLSSTRSSNMPFVLASKGTGSFQIDGASANLTLSGTISGDGGLMKSGPGTLTLSGNSTYGGHTTAAAGALKVTGSLADDASDSVYVSAGTDFKTASISRRVQASATYAGLGSTAIGTAAGIIGSSADIRAGQDNGNSPTDLAMQWRVRAIGDGPGVGSDVLNLTGMSSVTGTHVQTDPFALQMTYNPAALGGGENVLAAEGLLVLGWLDLSQNQPLGLWENAALGNFGSGLPGDVFQNVQSSWDAFAAANGVTDANVGNFLGSYGVDVAHHTVWAVVNHNSQFAAVPEPASWA